jgi:hypothetical protein
MTANASAKFVGQSDPSFSYTLSGLKGADTSSVLTNPTVTRPAGETAGASYTLTPSATAANYTIVPVTASFTIMAQGQLLITVGNTSRAYGTLTSSNIAAAAAVSASYCTIGADCSLAASIITLNVVAGTSANAWIATDSKPGTTQGNYTLTITPPTLTAANSSVGGFLNVGTYAFTPSTTVVTNPGFSTNYAIGYPILIVPGAISITPLALTISAPTQTKVYDASNAITGKTLTASNAVSGDQLTITGSGTYASANATTGLSYTISTIALSGADAGNYSFAGSVTGTNGAITKVALTISGATVASKTYDGTNTASFSGGTLNGVVSSDSANLTLTQTGSFSQVNVGNNLVVTAADTLGGSAAVNYTLTQPTGLIANITPKELTVTGTTVANKTYDGTTTAAVSGGTLVGRVTGDTTTGLTEAGTFSSANVGSGLTVTITDALTNNSLGNYILTQPTGLTANIAAKALTVTGTTVASKTYDGTATATVTGGTLAGKVGSDAVTLTEAGTFGQANVGTNLPVTIADSLTGSAAGNYTLTQPSGLIANITAKAVTVTGTTVANKVYDGNNAAAVSGGSLVGVISGEAIGLNQAGTFSSTNVGNSLAVTISDTLTNNSAGNYALTQPTGFTANITSKELTVTGTTVANKTYDGAATATVAGGSLVGKVGSDVVTLTEAGIFSQASVGSNLAITMADSISGAAAGNYTLTQPTGLRADITAKALSITAAAVSSKVYDATTTATMSGTINGLISADTTNVTLIRAGDFSQANIGTNLVVTAAYAISGTAAGNYTLTQPAGLTANITTKTLTITGAVIANKTYDGTNIATFSAGTLNGVMGSDSASLTLTQAATFSQANVGNNLVVTAADLLSGPAASNYTLTQPTGLIANITKASLGITLTATYAASTTVTPTAFTVNGLVNNETITGVSSASINSASVAANGSNYVTAITIGGGTAVMSNYAITQAYNSASGSTQNTATMNAKALTITANNVTTAVYGTAYALGTSAFTSAGLSSDDAISAVTLSYGSATTVSALTNVGSYSAGVIPSAALGTGLANYAITYVPANLTIGQATLTITPNAASTVYNGTTLNNATYSQAMSNYTVSGYKNSDSVVNVPVVLTGSMSFGGATNTVVQNAASYSLAAGTLAGSSSNANYTITFANTANNAYVITPVTLSISASKVYDGTVAFAGSSVLANTGVGSQTVVLTGSANANSANVLGVSSLNTTGLQITNGTLGGLAVNYILPASTGNVSITPAVIAVTIATQTKVYDATTTANLSAGSSGSAGSYLITGFATGQGAYINQTSASYNSADVASATTVATTLNSANYVATGSTNLSNYSLPLSISGNGSITRATLTITANDAAKFIGQADPLFTYTLSGLKGADTSSVLINPAVTRPAGNTAGATYTLTPGATAANYTIAPVTSTFTIIAQGQLLLTVGNTQTSYGSLKASTIASSTAVTASYCTIGSDCSAPYIVTLNVVPVASTNTWIATDDKLGAAQGNYTLTINSPTFSAANSSSGGYLNVGNYRFTPSITVITNPGYSTNYATSFPVLSVAGTISITPLALNIISPSPSKVYDASNAITGKTLTASNAVLGDQLNMSGSGTYVAANAGTNLLYTINSVAISGLDASNYSFSGVVAGSNGTITQAALTVSGISANNKVYDATQAATFSGTPSLIGVILGDSVSVTGSPTATFAQLNVANNIPVTFANSSLTLSNSNYFINGLIQSQTANITPALITITATKVYDGNTTVVSSRLVIVGIGNETLGASSGSAVLTNPNVGAASLQSLSNLVLANGTGLASNYTVVNPAFGNVTITPASLIITATNDSKVYGSTTTTKNAIYNVLGVATGLTGYSVAGLISGTPDAIATVTLSSTGGLASATVNGGAAYAITPVGATGSGLSNYIISYVDGAMTVTPAPIIVNATAASMVYGSSVPSLAYTFTGLVNGDSSANFSGSLATTAISTSNVGTNYPISRGTLTASGDYTITSYVATNIAITPAPITITAAKVYDGSTSVTASGLTIVGIAGQTLGVTSGSAILTNPNVGSAALQSLSNLVLANGTGLASNYTVANPVFGTVTITAAPLIISATAASMVYGGTVPSLAYTYTGLVGGDTSANISGNLTASATSTSNVGSNYPINRGTLAASGNYAIASYIPANITITPALLNITASADSKVYGNTATVSGFTYNGSGVAIGSTGYSVVGLLNNDSVSTVTSTSLGGQTTATVNGGTPYAIIPSAAAGAGLTNYSISYNNGQLTVTPRPLTIAIADKTIVYGAATLPNLTYSINGQGLVNGDAANVTLSTTATAYSGIAGSASSVGSYLITATTAAMPNYTITATAGTLTVSAANLTITASSQATTYGSPLVLSQSALAATGLVNGDYVTSATILSDATQTGQSGGNSTVVSGLINAGTYSSNLMISNAAGLGLSNYTIAYAKANLTVNKAILTISAVSDGKFITQSDTTGSATNCGSGCVGSYAGVAYSGFVNSDNATNGAITGQVTVTRSDANSSTSDSIGLHPGVLVPGVPISSNYTIVTKNGDYTVSPANQLVVKAGLVNTVYGVAPNYSAVSAAYMIYDANNNPQILANLPVSINGNIVTVTDTAGLGTTATFTLTTNASILSHSGNINVGTYSINNQNTNGISITPPVVVGNNFSNGMVVMGALNVTPKVLNFTDLGINGVTKPYDGSVYMTGLTLATTPSAFIAGDIVSALATGSFSTQNVGDALGYTVGITFSSPTGNTDFANYTVSGGAVYIAGGNGSNGPANGAITQLNSVTYTGPSGGNWSNPANWTTTGTTAIGAVPTQSSFGPSGGTPNVANVIIPVGKSVVYDAAVGTPVTSAVADSGNLTINLPSATTLAMPISGSGSVTIAGLGVITLAGNSSYTGQTILNAGTSLIAGANSAIGAGNIQSSNGSFSTLSGVVLPAVNASGSLILLSDISTAGSQSYGNLKLATTTNLISQGNGNISLLGTVDGSSDKTQSLTVNAGSGVVTLGDSIGSIARLNSIDITGGSIYILADILTATTQQYTGRILIGDASYLNKPAVTGFLFSNYRPYFEYQRGSLSSTIDYKNANSIYVRTLISEDPSVIFNGAVNDVTANTHTLLVAAISPSIADAASNPPVIQFAQPVGAYQPLYSLNSQLAINKAVVAITSQAQYVGSITIVGGASTYASQTYSAASMTASAVTNGGQVKFSV